jgi:hypothetical protein
MSRSVSLVTLSRSQGTCRSETTNSEQPRHYVSGQWAQLFSSSAMHPHCSTRCYTRDDPPLYAFLLYWATNAFPPIPPTSTPRAYPQVSF